MLSDDDHAEIAAGKAMQALIEHPSWKVYRELLEKIVEAKFNEIVSPVGSVEAAFAQNTAKGTIAGLRFAIGQPEFTVARMDEIRRTEEEAGRLDEENQESDTESDNGT